MPIASLYRRLLIPIYLPSFLLAASQQALLILVPLYVLELGGGAAFAAVVMGLRGLGMLLFDLPAGVLVSRFGDKPSMMGGLVCMTVTGVAFALVENLWLLAPFAILYGVGTSAWMLGRLSYMTDSIEVTERGRALACIGGLMRLGSFIGPALGGAAAEFLGYTIRALQNWRVRGGGPRFVRVSARSIRYRLLDLIRWADERTYGHTSEY